MIGVAAPAEDMDVAREFFELFKTPWEPAVPGRRYPVVLSTIGNPGTLDPDLLVLYGSSETDTDRASGAVLESASGPSEVTFDGSSFPVYGSFASFRGHRLPGLVGCRTGAVDYRHRSPAGATWRVGYDLFHEVRHLLTKGQPDEYAPMPTLEWHIEVLRTVLVESRVPFVEVPPRPAGHDFICCLTHDIDFLEIRRHTFDLTLAGFIGRASIGTAIDLCRGRRSLAEAIRNWAAVASLPLVHLGLMRDIWQPLESYAKADAPRRSTFFLVPRKGHAGTAPDGTVRPLRAVNYEVSEIRDGVRELVNGGHEVAVHGIDAWQDAGCGRAEMTAVTAVSGTVTAGVRMHWLYFAPDAAAHLEAAGFTYDSTWGFNDVIGYRAGTPQVFRLAASRNLLELPLTIMDTALFYAGNLALTREEALVRCRVIVAHARRFGGTVVVNWHDRSLAPERLWGRSYEQLLAALGEADRTWFATASEAVDWFRWRRSIRFHRIPESRCVTVDTSEQNRVDIAAMIRVHRPDAGGGSTEDVPFDGRQAVRVRV
jgi:hypothetical protein